MTTFICSINKKHTQIEVASFEIEVDLRPQEDPNELSTRIRVAAIACNSDKIPAEYKNFDGNLFWMDAICLS